MYSVITESILLLKVLQSGYKNEKKYRTTEILTTFYHINNNGTLTLLIQR